MSQTYEQARPQKWGPEAEAVKTRVHAALRHGRGIAVFPLVELLLEGEEFDLTGLPEGRRRLEVGFAYRAGRMDVETFPATLPSDPGEAVLVYRAQPLNGTPDPVAKLLDALKVMTRASGTGAEAVHQAAQDAAAAVRAMLSPTRPKRK
ncbi:hypothetical protein OG897_39425 [Streptomyces sp. NBC_00237]|uniref:hypothetical protein n=1 Tax=Streptomyces sp. NBC_00237 TaxID=2975687 RepID=UPI00224CC04B|nr:hypothetical protein [Streptomyces sp. NBC_00237]MCX5207461.1 hypothetical protein [Streptomyces sp. NBC_00237]